jgi:hypothetical protein
MVDMSQVVLGAVAVSIMVLVPIGCVLVWDLIAGRWDDSIRRWREKRAEGAEHRRAVRALRDQKGIPLEQLAADLRRLRVLLGQDEHRSAAHQIGNRLAYDRLMMQICAMLKIEHELDCESVGVERDIERLRVEAELERAGVVLSDRHYGQAA